MIRGAIVFATVLVLATTSVSAKDDDDKAETAEAAKEKKICKTEKMTGSLTRVRRVCLTRTEWSRLAEGTRENVRDLERDANQVQAEATRQQFGGPGAGL